MALIEVSAGFHGDLTGPQNVYLRAPSWACRRGHRPKFDQIVEFAGISDAIDTPVKRYRAGMNARLGFSTPRTSSRYPDHRRGARRRRCPSGAFGRVRDQPNSGIGRHGASTRSHRRALHRCILLDRGSRHCGTAAKRSRRMSSRMTGHGAEHRPHHVRQALSRAAARYALRPPPFASPAHQRRLGTTSPILVRVRSCGRAPYLRHRPSGAVPAPEPRRLTCLEPRPTCLRAAHDRGCRGGRTSIRHRVGDVGDDARDGRPTFAGISSSTRASAYRELKA